jgi:hypothetical protein
MNKCTPKNTLLHYALAISLCLPWQALAIAPVARLSMYIAGAVATTYLGHLYCSKPQPFEPSLQNL